MRDEEIGMRGIHFVDEAMPPKVIKGMCEEIVRLSYPIKRRE